jgi:hypothetical protein
LASAGKRTIFLSWAQMQIQSIYTPRVNEKRRKEERKEGRKEGMMTFGRVTASCLNTCD